MSKTTSTALKILLPLVVLGLVAAAYTLFSSKAAVPDVRFTTLDGKTLATGDLKGKVTLVNFWATSCTTCVKEMPKIVETYNKFAARGFETVAVAMSYDQPDFVANYARQNNLPFKVALDGSGEAAQKFGDIRLTPTTFLIDRQGRIVKKYLGEPDFGQLQQLVEELLKQPA